MKNENQIRIEQAMHLIFVNTEKLIDHKTTLQCLQDGLHGVNDDNKVNTRMIQLEFDCELLEVQNDQLNRIIESEVNNLVKAKDELQRKIEKQ